MSDQSREETVKKKVEQIYENFGLDMEDMDTEEVERIINYYLSNEGQLDKDYKKSLDAKKLLPRDEDPITDGDEEFDIGG